MLCQIPLHLLQQHDLKNRNQTPRLIHPLHPLHSPRIRASPPKRKANPHAPLRVRRLLHLLHARHGLLLLDDLLVLGHVFLVGEVVVVHGVFFRFELRDEGRWDGAEVVPGGGLGGEGAEEGVALDLGEGCVADACVGD